LRSTLFWDITQRRVAISYGSFENTIGPILLKDKEVQEENNFLALEGGTNRLSQNVGNYHSTMHNIPE
jgi:hypothetical protein